MNDRREAIHSLHLPLALDCLFKFWRLASHFITNLYPFLASWRRYSYAAVIPSETHRQRIKRTCVAVRKFFCVSFAFSLPLDPDEWSMHTFRVRSWYKDCLSHVNGEDRIVCHRLCIRGWAGPWTPSVRTHSVLTSRIVSSASWPLFQQDELEKYICN